MSEERKFEMMELKSGEKFLATNVRDRIFLAFEPSPISLVVEDAYVKSALKALDDKDNRDKIYEAAGLRKQVLIRLETSRGETPWWAPVTVHKIAKKIGPEDTLVLLKNEPEPINHY